MAFNVECSLMSEDISEHSTLPSNISLVDLGSFGHLLQVKGIKTSASSISFASGHGRDTERGCESTNHGLLSTPRKSFL